MNGGSFAFVYYARYNRMIRFIQVLFTLILEEFPLLKYEFYIFQFKSILLVWYTTFYRNNSYLSHYIFDVTRIHKYIYAYSCIMQRDDDWLYCTDDFYHIHILRLDTGASMSTFWPNLTVLLFCCCDMVFTSIWKNHSWLAVNLLSSIMYKV